MTLITRSGGTRRAPRRRARAAGEAADGSTLTTSHEGVRGVPAAGVASFAHTHVVTGGTGRFEGAVGRLTVAGEIDLGALTVTGTVSGWLSY